MQETPRANQEASSQYEAGREPEKMGRMAYKAFPPTPSGDLKYKEGEKHAVKG